MDFRYLIPEKIFNELQQELEKADKKFIAGWLFADRRENFAIVNGYTVTSDDAKSHDKPKSWMRLKKDKIHQMRKFKEEDGKDIVWQFHSHPNGKKELHEMDLKILNYLSTGVMIILVKGGIVGWYYDKRDTKKPTTERMDFEIMAEIS
jgi:proteasome lid subunit RPN8/RPN11